MKHCFVCWLCAPALLWANTSFGQPFSLPPFPGTMGGIPSYYRIPLEAFTAFNPAPSLRDIEASHAQEIREDITPVRPDHHPYATYGDGIRMAQGLYLAALTNRMIEIVGTYAGALPNGTGFSIFSFVYSAFQGMTLRSISCSTADVIRPRMPMVTMPQNMMSTCRSSHEFQIR